MIGWVRQKLTATAKGGVNWRKRVIKVVWVAMTPSLSSLRTLCADLEKCAESQGELLPPYASEETSALRYSQGVRGISVAVRLQQWARSSAARRAARWFGTRWGVWAL